MDKNGSIYAGSMGQTDDEYKMKEVDKYFQKDDIPLGAKLEISNEQNY